MVIASAAASLLAVQGEKHVLRWSAPHRRLKEQEKVSHWRLLLMKVNTQNTSLQSFITSCLLRQVPLTGLLLQTATSQILAQESQYFLKMVSLMVKMTM